MISAILVCGTVLVNGAGNHTVAITGENEALYAPKVMLKRVKPGIYEDGIQFRLTIAKDHSRIWLNSDTHDARGRGAMIRCNK